MIEKDQVALVAGGHIGVPGIPLGCTCFASTNFRLACAQQARRSMPGRAATML
ncbi:hypothetical protein FQZ97_409550 [compost metagenome]